MTIGFSRRSLIGATATGTALVMGGAQALAKAAPAADKPLFGPAPGVALLSRNENPYGPAPSALRAISDAAPKGCYYSMAGSEVLAPMIAERHGVKPENIVLGNGSTEVLSAAALAWAAKGEIVAPELFWDTTVEYAEAKGAKVNRVPLASDMGIDLAALAAAVTPNTGLVHICNPNNPTGMVLDGNQLRQFVRSVSPKATVLVDEAYNELTDKPDYNSVVELVKEGHNLIVCRTFSKIYGMAGLRVGYAITTPEMAEVIRGYLMSFGGNEAGLAAAIGSYNDTAFLTYSKQRIVEARGLILDAVKSAGLTALPSQTNFVYVKVPDADTLQKAMAEQNIMIRGSYGPKWTRWSRVSTGKIEDVKRYAAALPKMLSA